MAHPRSGLWPLGRPGRKAPRLQARLRGLARHEGLPPRATGAAGGPAEPFLPRLLECSRLPARTVWLFDLDDTLHNATQAVMGELRLAMGDYIVQQLGIGPAESDALRTRYWQRYGATLLGLVRHHGVRAAHFLSQTHQLQGLEQRVRGQAHDLAALARLPGRKFILTNAPAAYAARVLGVLGVAHHFEGVLSIEDMQMFGHLRPKPDARMLRWVAAGLRVAPAHCVLVEDTLAHQKAARSMGMRTVWMQRWLRRTPGAARLRRRPAYVDQRVTRLLDLKARVGAT